MRALILGSSGIIGQHMRLCVPRGVDAIFHRQAADRLHRGLDLNDTAALYQLLESEKPNLIVNLAGENRPDVVERSEADCARLNVQLPLSLADWSQKNGAHLVQVSSQAALSDVNAYGRQKRMVEERLSGVATIARPTFVLGVRPMPGVGRTNPAEQILEGQGKQVADRWFSTSFAQDVAEQLWRLAQLRDPLAEVQNIGVPIRTNRHQIALALGRHAEAVRHEDFMGLAPRPFDTSYAESLYGYSFLDGIGMIQFDWQARQDMGMWQRARDISVFLGQTAVAAYSHLQRGWSYLHGAVAEDFRRADTSSDEALLEWYRKTESYIWELSFYHSDPGWNYRGMCSGIMERLRVAGARRVLCLGDGIGDLTLWLRQAGLDAVYHDLARSRTAEFALARYFMHTGQEMPTDMTAGWEPDLRGGPYDAVISLDFLEHVTNVPAWTGAIKRVMVPGGLFGAQNAFALGSGPRGSIPMHLERNDRYEREWDPLLFSQGFEQLSPQWYKRAA